jgi:hypothetical protein
MALIDLRVLPERVKPGKSFQIAAKKEDPSAIRPNQGRLEFLGRWSTISPGWREAGRVAHEELDQPTSNRSPTPESEDGAAVAERRVLGR